METGGTGKDGVAGKACVVLGTGRAVDARLVEALTAAGARARLCACAVEGEPRDGGHVDIFDEEALRAAVRGADVLFCTVADFSFGRGTAARAWRTNADGVRMACLAAEAEGVRRMVHCGSILCLGRQTSDAPVDASTPYLSDDSRTAVERSLFRGEMEVWRAAERGVRATVVCAGWVEEDLRPALESFLRGGGSTMPPMESAYVSAAGLAEALVAAAGDDYAGKRVVCAGRNAPLASLADDIAARLGLSTPTRVLTDRQTGVLLRLPRRVASRWLFEPGMGRLLTRRDRYA